MKKLFFVFCLFVGTSRLVVAQHNWEGLDTTTNAGESKTQDRCAGLLLRNIGTFTGAARPFTIKVVRNATGTTLMESNWVASPNGSWSDTGGNGGGAYNTYTGVGMPSIGDVFSGSYPQADNALGSVTVTMRAGTTQNPGQQFFNQTSNFKFHATGIFPGYNGCLLIKHSFSVPIVEKTTRIVGAVMSNCSTQHTLTLIVNGAVYQHLVTSAFATRQNPSTVQIDASQSNSFPDWEEGNAWTLAVDGNSVISGNFAWPCPPGNQYCSGNNLAVTWQLPPSAGRNDATQFFDCAPPQGTLQLHGDLTVMPMSGAHTLSVKVNGVTRGTSTSTANSPTIQHVLINGAVSDVANGDTVEWFVDGVSQGSHPAVLTSGNCGGDPPVICWTGEDNWSGTVSGGASPTPPVTPPSPTPPPPGPTPPPNPSPPGHTPPPVPTPHPGSTGVTVQNPSDFYTPVLNALNDAGQGFPTNLNADGFAPVDTSYRGHLDDVHGKIQEMDAKSKQIEQRARGLLGSIKAKFQQLPTTLGTVTTLNLGGSAFGGAYGGTVPLSDWSAQISILRLFILWVMSIGFAMLILRAFGWQH